MDFNKKRKKNDVNLQEIFVYSKKVRNFAARYDVKYKTIKR